MLSMETAAVSSPSSALDGVDKPRAPRFEAFVMTGDAMLNLSRATTAQEASPAQKSWGRRRRRPEAQPPSNSVPTSPSEVSQQAKKQVWENGDPQTKAPETPVRNSKSEETLRMVEAQVAPTKKDVELNREEVQIKPKEGLIPEEMPKRVEEEPRPQSTDRSPTRETAKRADKIVWTYNAPLSGLSEKEIRRYEADQFWNNTWTDPSTKQPKSPTQVVTVEDDKATRDQEKPNSDSPDDEETSKDNKEGVDLSSAKQQLPPPPEEEGEVMASAVRPSLTRSSTEEESDADSLQSVHFSPKGVDMPSAIRLAKRLFTLDGFQKSDVSRHLSRNNEFNRVVAEEYLKHFDFDRIGLDTALRRFLQAFQLTGESSERDRVLVHFSRRYLECNPDSFASQDGVHILTCALLLLNSDLHGKHQGMKRMTCAQFIKRLSGLNDGGNFPVDLLRRLYAAIKEHPLEWATDNPPAAGNAEDQEPPDVGPVPTSNKELASNPYLDIPTPTQSQEFKKGYIMRKCCAEPGGKRTALGKRGWRMYFAVLKDLCLYLYKDEATCKGELPPKTSTLRCKKSAPAETGPASLIRVHHALAASAPDYTKKKNVFRLFTADQAQFLIQASDAKEWRCWMDALNTAASLLSAPPLAAPCGSQQRFQRPLLPASLTKFSPRDQLMDHEDRVAQLEDELLDHRANPPSTKAKTTVVNSYREKDAFLHFEKTRYEAYVAVCGGLQSIMADSVPMSRDVSLLEIDELPNDSGTNSPDLKLNVEDDGGHRL